jgi:LAS superfamily LD-carboxypeptidase LdcB
LSKAFYEAFSKPIIIVSAFRDYKYQVWIKTGWCPDSMCAKAWYSEHQTGLSLKLRQKRSLWTI